MEMCAWKRKPEKEYGVIVGCDSAQEWLLEWWWERYSAENAFPVSFVDMGMSPSAQQWCRKRGELIALNLDMSFIKLRKEIEPELVHKWDYSSEVSPDIWESRSKWFKKPFALLHSPFKRSVWLDLDCEILGSIHALFSQDASSELALVREYASSHLPRIHPDVRYNGGVIVFAHGSEILQKWAGAAVTRNHCFPSDDVLLSALIYEWQFPVLDLPEIYNWVLRWGLNINAIIHHWCGPAGKAYIKNQGGIKPALQALFRGERRF
jgi:hypothetical protein